MSREQLKKKKKSILKHSLLIQIKSIAKSLFIGLCISLPISLAFGLGIFFLRKYIFNFNWVHFIIFGVLSALGIIVIVVGFIFLFYKFFLESLLFNLIREINYRISCEINYKFKVGNYFPTTHQYHKDLFLKKKQRKEIKEPQKGKSFFFIIRKVVNSISNNIKYFFFALAQISSGIIGFISIGFLFLQDSGSRKDAINDILLLLGILLVLFSIPALIIYWVLNPNDIKRPIQIVVFFLSTGSGSIYFYFNQEKFTSLSDKIAFFGAITLVPVGIIEYLL